MNNSKLQSAPNSNSRQIQILLDSNSCRIQNRTRFKFVPDSNSRTIKIRTQLKFAHNSNSRTIQIRTQVNKYPSSHFHCASKFNHRTGTYVRLLGPCFKTGRMKPFRQDLECAGGCIGVSSQRPGTGSSPKPHSQEPLQSPA